MKVSVMIPSYRRPAELVRCLSAVRTQLHEAEQVVVVVREGDRLTRAAINSWQSRFSFKVVEVASPGAVAAMNAGVARCTGEIVAITDDDAMPRPDWVARIVAHFDACPEVGGVGGRDRVNENDAVDTGEKRLVGRVLWYGRVAGNHHLGAGPAREVDILKGVNCAFRADALRKAGFETRLRGEGAQAHWEICLCFAMQRAGWRIVYDPAIEVDHYPAPRFDRDRRGVFDAGAAADRAFNFRLALGAVSPPWRRAMAIGWHNVIGTGDAPGFARVCAMMARGDHQALSRYRAVRAAYSGGRE